MTSVNGQRSNNETVRAAAWRCLCVAHGARCIADRSWKFFLPLYLSKSCGVRPTAAITLAQNLAVATLSTAAADLFRRTGTHSFTRATILENVAVVLGGLLLSLFASQAEVDSSQCESPIRSPIFVLAVICGCIDAVCSSLLSTVIEKEWVAILFQTKDRADGQDDLLAFANSRLSQIDLLAATACPLLVSYLVQSRGGYSFALLLLATQHAIGAVIILTNVRLALQLFPDLIVTRKQSGQAIPKAAVNPFRIFMDDTVSTRTKLLTCAFLLLFFTVLSPGSVMTAWLNHARQTNLHPNMTEHNIAWFGSSSNLLGAIATLLTPPLISFTGKYHAAIIAQYFQLACIWIATFCFHQNRNWLMLGFLLPIAISRIGLWGFDLVERQILQESISRGHCQAIYFNSERSLTQLVSLGMTYLSYIYSDVASFSVLVNLSSLAVTTSSILLAISMICYPLSRNKIE